MGTTLQECQRTGHNFVINRDRTAFACSHGCGERRVRIIGGVAIEADGSSRPLYTDGLPAPVAEG